MSTAELCVSKWKRFCHSPWIPVKRLGRCVISCSAYQLSVRFPSPSSFALDPCALSCALSEPLWSCSPSVFWPPVPADLHSTVTFSWKAFFFPTQSLCGVCACGFAYDRGVWVILFERAVKATVTGASGLCWPSSFTDFSPPQLSRMNRQQAMFPVSITLLDV